MSKIIYHKSCFKHKEVQKVKRMLNSIDKQFGGLFCCYIDLTGINDIDRLEIQNYIIKHLKSLKKKIDENLLKNYKVINGDLNEEYEEGFYTLEIAKEFNLIELLNEIHLYIRDNYPKIATKKTKNYTFKSDSSEAKYNELKEHLENYPVFGFCKEYFVKLKNGETKEVHAFTFSHFNLRDAKSFFVKSIKHD